MKILAGISAVLISSLSFAEGFNLDKLQDVSKIAIQKFKTDHADMIEHATGYKTWKSGDDGKVKIYVDHNGMKMEFNYVCHQHEINIECHDN